MEYNKLINKIKSSDCSIMLYGAEASGRRALKKLRENNIEPCCFIDDKKNRQGTSVNGIPVFSLERAFETGGETYAVIIITSFQYASILKRLDNANFPAEKIFFCHELIIEDLDKSGLAAHRDEVKAFYDGLGDNKSKKILECIIYGRQEHNLYELPLLKDDMPYFPTDIFSFHDEVFIDGGAFIGDTILDFQKNCASVGARIKKVYAFEPDPKNAEYLRSNKDITADMQVIEAGLYDKDGWLNFCSGNGESCKLDDAIDSKVKVIAADSLEWDEPPTFVKMDIEGAELAALHGMENLIKQHKPKLAICIYHKQSDIWEIPSYIKSIVPEYKFFIRNYTNWLNDIVLYGVIEETPAR